MKDYDDGERVSCNRLSAEMAKLRAERDELAAQVDVMREAIKKDASASWVCVSRHPKLRAALALPNTAATILRQRDARTLREAAEKLCPSGYDDTSYMGLIRLADELERKNG